MVIKKAVKKKPAVTVELGKAYKKLIKKGQWIMVEFTDCGSGRPRRARWMTNDHRIETRMTEHEMGYCLVVAKPWNQYAPEAACRECDVVLDVELDKWVTLTNDCLDVELDKWVTLTNDCLDVELDKWVTLTNDCIVCKGFKIWVLEQRVVSGLIRKMKIKPKKKKK